MEKKNGVLASLETPTGLRFPSIEASRPAAAPVLEEYFGFMYIGEMLKEWRNTNEDATLERLLAEASSEHLLWEAERANQELTLFVNRVPIVDKILQYAFSGTPSSPAKETQQQIVSVEEIKNFCQELLSMEVRQGGVFDDSGQTRIIHHLFSSFFSLEDESGKPRFRDPPPDAGTLLQVLAYRPQSREKVLSYLVDTPADLFVDFFLLHLDHVIVSDVLTTLVSLLSQAPPSAWLPTGGPRVLQVPLSEFDVSPRLVRAFNEWLIAGSFVDRVIEIILQSDYGEDKRKREEVIEKAFGLLGQVVMIARSHLLNGLLPPPIFYEFMAETRFKPFLLSVLQHKNDKVVGEGLGFLSSLLICDRMREGEKRKRADKQTSEAVSTMDQDSGLSSSPPPSSPSSFSSSSSSELQQPVTPVVQSDSDSVDNGSPDGFENGDKPGAGDKRKNESDRKKYEEETALLESPRFNQVLVEVLKDGLPLLVRRLRRNAASELPRKPDWQREAEAKEAESDAMPKQRTGGRECGGKAPLGVGDGRQGGGQRKEAFGLLRLKIVELMRALLLHFTVPSADDTLADEFFALLSSLSLPALLMELLIENPRMDILHTVIIQTIKPIFMKEKTRVFLHAVVKEGSFVRQIIQILPLCGLAGSQDHGELAALRPPVKEIMSTLTRASVTDPELTSLLNDQGWWDQSVVTNSAEPRTVIPP